MEKTLIMNRFVLASGSPRRKELLSQVGIRYEVIKSDIEEITNSKAPEAVVMDLSGDKARDVYSRLSVYKGTCNVVIGADTIVWCNGKILGKPADKAQAHEMLTLLSGQTHSVYTGVTVITDESQFSFYEKTDVNVYEMTETEIDSYIESGEPMDKAGAYGIQGRFAAYIKGINGDYNNVVGLPIGRLCQELKKRHIEYVTTADEVKMCMFDLDGTIADSVGAIAGSANTCLKSVGLSEQPVESYKAFAGDGQYELIKRALRAAGDTELAHYDEVMTMYIRIFKDRCSDGVVPYPGVLNMLNELKNRGIKITVLSNKHDDNAIKVVEDVFGKGFFDYILGQRDGFEKKPSPQGVHEICEMLKIDVDNVLYVGDTGVDMLTGKRAGAITVGVTWGFRDRSELEAADAVYVIDEPKEIIDLL